MYVCMEKVYLITYMSNKDVLAVRGLIYVAKDKVPCSIFIFGKILGLMKYKFLQNLQMSTQYYVHCTQYPVFLCPIHLC